MYKPTSTILTYMCIYVYTNNYYVSYIQLLYIYILYVYKYYTHIYIYRYIEFLYKYIYIYICINIYIYIMECYFQLHAAAAQEILDPLSNHFHFFRRILSDIFLDLTIFLGKL